MRNQIISTIYQLMQQHENIYFLTGDLGYHALEKLRDFGPRFINCGIAEQNMIGVASGLAMSGHPVYAYSIIPFITLRCLEQIRNDICFHNLNVTILGVGSGFSYEYLGKTHYALEDLGLMNLLPNMKVLIPSDGLEGSEMIKAIYPKPGPAYLSIGKYKNVSNQPSYKFKLGQPYSVLSGSDITIYSCGQLIWQAQKACQFLKEKYQLKANLINVNSLNPLDFRPIQNYARHRKMIFVIDEHTFHGGISSIISQALIGINNLAPIKFICLENQVYSRIGSYDYLINKYQLSTSKIVKQILKSLCI